MRLHCQKCTWKLAQRTTAGAQSKTCLQSNRADLSYIPFQVELTHQKLAPGVFPLKFNSKSSSKDLGWCIVGGLPFYYALRRLQTPQTHLKADSPDLKVSSLQRSCLLTQNWYWTDQGTVCRLNFTLQATASLRKLEGRFLIDTECTTNLLSKQEFNKLLPSARNLLKESDSHNLMTDQTWLSSYGVIRLP